MGAVLYFPVLLAAVVLWLGWGSPFSFRWLLVVAGLPWLSFFVSLPSMLTLQVSPRGGDRFSVGKHAELMLQGTTAFPMPPFRGRLRLYPISGERRFWYDPLQGIPTAHCGGYRVQVERGRVYDYLGLFCLPIFRKESLSFAVLPLPREAPMPDLENPPVRFWRASPGAPPAEQYELRQFHWGDELKSLHWKLSLKTGKALIRQSQSPESPVLTLDFVSRGNRIALDEKYGKLLWLGGKLLERNVEFQIRGYTGAGVSVVEIRDKAALEQELVRLLLLPPAPADAAPETSPGLWLWSVEEEMPCKLSGLA